MLPKTEDLIREKEKQGALISVYAKSFVFVVMIFLQAIVFHDRAELMHIFTIFLPGIILRAAFAYHLHKNRGITALGWLSVFMDFVIIVVIPFIWYGSEGGGATPRTYLLKTALPFVILPLLAISTLALKPGHPLGRKRGEKQPAFTLLFAECRGGTHGR